MPSSKRRSGRAQDPQKNPYASSATTHCSPKSAKMEPSEVQVDDFPSTSAAPSPADSTISVHSVQSVACNHEHAFACMDCNTEICQPCWDSHHAMHKVLTMRRKRLLDIEKALERYRPENRAQMRQELEEKIEKRRRLLELASKAREVIRRELNACDDELKSHANVDELWPRMDAYVTNPSADPTFDRKDALKKLKELDNCDLGLTPAQERFHAKFLKDCTAIFQKRLPTTSTFEWEIENFGDWDRVSALRSIDSEVFTTNQSCQFSLKVTSTKRSTADSPEIEFLAVSLICQPAMSFPANWLIQARYSIRIQAMECKNAPEVAVSGSVKFSKDCCATAPQDVTSMRHLLDPANGFIVDGKVKLLVEIHARR